MPSGREPIEQHAVHRPPRESRLCLACAQRVVHPGGWLWIPLALLFWAAVAAGTGYLLFRVKPARQQSGVERARDILAERLARGEISTEEYYDRLSPLS